MTAVSDVDDLFRLPLEEFTAARNGLAATLKKSERGDEADRVKRLPKPPISAWTVNQLFWRHRKAFDRLVAAGETFREAQAAQLEGKSGDLRGPLEARREALADLATRAATVLREAGHNPTPDIMRRVTTTLEALATYGSHPDAPQAGRLTDDVDAPGFEALAALIPRSGKGGRAASEATRVIPFRQKPEPPARKSKNLSPEELEKQREAERKAALAAAKASLQEAERTLRDARRTAEQAEGALKKAAARAKEAEKEKGELEKQFEKVTAAAEEARQEARRVASEAENAAQALAEAEQAVEKARSAIDELNRDS